MTWKEFKTAVEEAGVVDENEVFYIDTGNYPDSLNIRIEDKKVIVT